jgi:hypothetical protein
MIETTLVNQVFREGENVVLARGSYAGTPGVFLHLREDPNWADIAEPDGRVRRHPVEWLEHSTSTETKRTSL